MQYGNTGVIKYVFLKPSDRQRKWLINHGYTFMCRNKDGIEQWIK